MKKSFTLISALALAATASFGTDFSVQSFLSPAVQGPYSVTNAACASCFSNVLYGGITISNAASAPLGGLTNVDSWNNSTTAPIQQGTNCPRLTWTNSSGIWVIPTNGVPGTLAGVSFKQGPNRDDLLVDIDLPVIPSGGIPIINASNTWASDNNSYPLSPYSLSCRIFGDTGAATKLDFVVVGLPDGVNEIPDVAGPFPKFNWGVVPIAGTTVCMTNFPLYKFVGCKKIRLRSATLTTATAANIGVTIQALTFNGPRP